MRRIIKNEYKVNIYEDHYSVTVYHADLDLNEKNDNYDIEIAMDNGKRYSGSIFTLENIKSIMNKDKQTGESCHGLYFGGCKDLLIVETLSIDVIARLVASIYDDKMIEEVFVPLDEEN